MRLQAVRGRRGAAGAGRPPLLTTRECVNNGLLPLLQVVCDEHGVDPTGTVRWGLLWRQLGWAEGLPLLLAAPEGRQAGLAAPLPLPAARLAAW